MKDSDATTSPSFSVNNLSSVLLESQIPTLEIFADEEKMFDMAKYLRGKNVKITPVNIPNQITVEWINQSRPLKTGEKYAYGELLRIITAEFTMQASLGTIHKRNMKLSLIHPRIYNHSAC